MHQSSGNMRLVPASMGTLVSGSSPTDTAVPVIASGTTQADCEDRDTLDHLNLAERLAVRVGEWVGALAEWWQPDYIPPFAGDARVAATCAAFAEDAPSDLAI